MLASYQVAVRPRKHLYDVVLELDGLDGAPLELWMASWTPGSYLIREYARHVQEIRAESEHGAALPLTRVSEDAWRLEPGGHSLVRVRYAVYAFDLTVRTSHLDETHAYLNGAALFLTCDALAERPTTVRLDLPADWRVSTALHLEREGTYRAATFDELCDCPIHASPTDRQTEFEVSGIPHRLVVWGRGNEELEGLTQDVKAIVQQTERLFGGLPYERYLFLTLLTDRGRGGLEHRESATLLSPRFGFRPDKSRQEFLFLVAHELFHAWVVKRLRPANLLPYRLRIENHTRLLWFFEGFTSYYETLIAARAGLITPARLLEVWGERMTQLARTPGRKVQSLEEASLTAWVKYYRPDENSSNSAVSYYLKGSLVALALEGELRARGRSVDEVLRLLWTAHGVPETGLGEDAVLAACEQVAGEPLPAIAAAVTGTADPDYAALASLGLRARFRARDAQSDKGGTRARAEREPSSYLGLGFKPDRLTLQTVLSDGPAERAGLSPEDELIAADGYRLSPESVGLRLEQLPPKTSVRLAYFRRDELRQTVLTTEERPLDTCWIERVETPSEPQQAAFLAWAGGALP